MAMKIQYRIGGSSVRLPSKKGFLRLSGLSKDYTKDDIRDRIAGLRSAPKKKITVADAPASIPTTHARPERKFSLLIDVQNSIKAQNSPGYEQWAKIFSLKQAAKTIMFLQDNNLDDLENLSDAAQKAKDDFNDLQTRIHAVDERLKQIPLLQKHIGTYVRQKIFTPNINAGNSVKSSTQRTKKASTTAKLPKRFLMHKGWRNCQPSTL